jgi:DNA-binding MarR family transcriptional regulator
MEYSIIRILTMEVSCIKSTGALTERLAWLFLEWRRFLQRRLVGYDISLPQLSLLRELGRHEFLLPSQIADHLHCDRPTASVVIKNLEKKGYIYRKKSKENARYHKLFLSQKGREYLGKINASVPPVTVSPFDVLSPEENEQLYALLKKCCDRVKEITN